MRTFECQATRNTALRACCGLRGRQTRIESAMRESSRGWVGPPDVRVTFNGKTCTTQTITPPLLRRFSYGNDPTERLPTAPTTPASRKLHVRPNRRVLCLAVASPLG